MFKLSWRSWLDWGRVVPLFTLMVAAGVEISAILHVFDFSPSPGEHVIIIILSLLAIDSLTERIKILERIKERLDGSPSTSPLQHRSDLPSVSEQTEDATQIDILAISGVALLEGHFPIFRRLLQQGCKFRILLLNPASPRVETWSEMVDASDVRQEIQATLAVLRDLRLAAGDGECTVRLSNVLPPFSLFAINPRTKRGSMCIDFHTLKIRMSERPLVRLHGRYHSEWIDLFRDQFEKAWGREGNIEYDWLAIEPRPQPDATATRRAG